MSGLEPPFITIAEASRRIARRELSPVELTDALLARIGALNSLGDVAHRRDALWQVEYAGRPAGPLLDSLSEQLTREADASPRMLLSMWSRWCMGRCPVEDVVKAPLGAQVNIGDRCCFNDTCRISSEWLTTLMGAMSKWRDSSPTRQRSGNVAE